MAIFGLFMKFNNQRKRILIISFFYPPSSMVGGKRSTFLSQILQKEHYEVHVLTLKEKCIAARDDSLPTPGIIHSVGMYPPYPIKKNKSFFKRLWNRLWGDYLCLLDRYSGWVLPALIKGLKIIKDNRIDVIIATGPPFSPMVTGFLNAYPVDTQKGFCIAFWGSQCEHQLPLTRGCIKESGSILECRKNSPTHVLGVNRIGMVSYLA